MKKISFSATGKVYLLGEHSVVYGKPALLTTINLRVIVSLTPLNSHKNTSSDYTEAIKIIEPIVKKHLKIKNIPPYQLTITSQFPLGVGLGSSAAISASTIAALLTLLKVKWDLNLVNNLTYQAEKVFHGNPSGADNSTIVFGGLIWYRKESEELKIIQPLPFQIPAKISRNFLLINTGKPKQSTRQMVEFVRVKHQAEGRQRRASPKAGVKFSKIFDDQEALVRKLPAVLKAGNEKELIKIIRAGERNLESIGVVSKEVVAIIRKIETMGGAAKICGAGASQGPTGILLCYHHSPSAIETIAKSSNLSYFKTNLGVAGLRKNEN